MALQMQILPTDATGRHFHVMAGLPGVLPLCDLAYDNSAEAVVNFMNISGALAEGRIEPNSRFMAEKALYKAFDNEIEHGIFVDAPPFRVVIMDCNGCHSPLLN